MFSGSEVWGSVIFDTESHEKRVVHGGDHCFEFIYLLFFIKAFLNCHSNTIYLMSNAFLSNVSS